MRDVERQKTYDAEQVVRADLRMDGERLKIHGSTVAIPVEKKFGHLEHIETYCNRVLQLPAVRAEYPNAAAKPIAVRHRKGNAAAHYETATRTIAVHDPKYGAPGWAMREIVVLHELAHHLTPMHGHDAAFREAFVFLVSEMIGAEVGWLLGVRFMDHGLAVVA